MNPLLKWYDTCKRDLPWRNGKDPYRIWVSEIMLQQTRVEAVKPYFKRFVEALPNLPALADAKEEELLKLWEGLGYYSRVRNMQKAAVCVCEKHGGQMPADYDELLKLPGIGSYTAGAIASIAFGIPRPAVDGNVLRVLARIRMDERDIADPKTKKAVEEELLPVMQKANPGDINQAFMELGACICVPNGAPLCEKCPLGSLCLTNKNGAYALYPVKSGKKARSIEEKTVFLIMDEERIALQKRAGKGLLAGLYTFPMAEGHLNREEAAEFLRERGMEPIYLKKLSPAKHIFSHKEWHMDGYFVKMDELAKSRLTGSSEDWIFAERKTVEEKYPIPSAMQSYTDYLQIKRGKENF